VDSGWWLVVTLRGADPTLQRSNPESRVPNPESRTRTTRVRVRYADTDQMGVVYYANYLVWFEIGRTEWLRDAGWNYREMEETGVSLPVIEAHCEYRQPARYDEEIEIRTTAIAVTPVRLRFDYQAVRVDGGALVALGHTVHAALGANGRPCRLPIRVRELLG
jgi:acyl-CoA thioester hydrolase